jgi:hypothetical protein
MLDNIKNTAKQVKKDYTEDVVDKLILGNDITNIKKKNYTIRR